MTNQRLLASLVCMTLLASAVEAGEWVKGNAVNAAGIRAFELYVPDGYRKGERRPLLVGIHGCTQTPQDFAGLTRSARLADEHRLLLLLPSQSALANPSLCWNWFLEGNQKRGQGEPSLIKEMVDWVKARYSVEESQVYVMGVSSGGFMTSIVLSCYADVFAAGAVASGGMYEGARDLVTALQVTAQGSKLDPGTSGQDAWRCSGSVHPRMVPVLVFDGGKDPYVSTANGQQVVAQFLQVNDLGDDGTDNDSISAEPASTGSAVSPGGLAYTWKTFTFGNTTLIQHYVVPDMSHAWSGGDAEFAYAEPRGPDQTAIIWNFLSKHRRGATPPKRRAVGR